MKKPKILIVDDQQTNINLLRPLLAEYEILEANGGRAGLRSVAENQPDLVILDIIMPGLDGYAVLSIIKHSPNTRGIPVILLTAIGGVHDRIKALELGADDFITKPINPYELQARVKALLKIKILYDELSEVHQMLISLANFLENKFEYMTGHSTRVAYLSVRMARKDLLPPQMQEEIRLAALLHDIGYYAIRESILHKPEALTAAEFEHIRIHPLAGERLCLPFTDLRPLLPYIRHHHEHLDGSGYPDGLSGSDIPLGARIIAIAEAYDALTHDRPQRKAFAPPTALEMLREEAGSKWDPRLVELFISLPSEDLVIY